MPDQSVAETLASIMETVAPVAEAVDGYRAQCLERGYSADAAEAMAIELHAQFIRTLFRGAN
jgi:hypothetical protein